MTPVLLDVTRTLYRQTTHATGIDRVEIAYIDWARKGARDALFLTRIGRSIAILDPPGLKQVRKLGSLDLVGWLQPHRDRKRRRREAQIRRYARAIVPMGRLPQKTLFRRGTTYLNVGHTHLSHDLIEKLMQSGIGRTATMIHDTIPLDFPDLQTPTSVERFDAHLKAALRSDVIVANSDHTRERVTHWAAGNQPDIATIPLGVDPVESVAPTKRDRPYFVILGTIEPRKDHDLLLDVWARLEEDMGENAPDLLIVGRRGWASDDLLRRLDELKTTSNRIHEVSSATDEEAAGYVAGAHALLFPSRAEGFGYPAFEAFQLGTKLICSELPVFREFFGDAVVYISSRDVNKWSEEIKNSVNAGKPTYSGAEHSAVEIPRWPGHFQRLEPLLDG